MLVGWSWKGNDNKVSQANSLVGVSEGEAYRLLRF